MNFTDMDIKCEYRSLIDDVVRDFYIPLLGNSVKYQRAVGFFSSSILVQISKGISGLVKNGGTIELVASPRLSPEDIEAIRTGYKQRNQVIKTAVLGELKSAKNRFEVDRLNLLANLISDGILEIKIAFLEDGNNRGLYHEKMGILIDSDGNKVAFSGSMNETENALMINYETIDVFCSWKSDDSKERVLTKENAFISIWNNSEPNIQIIDFPELKEEIIERYRVSKPNYDIDNEEYPVLEMPINSETLTNNYPLIPSSVKLHDYQKEAIKKWRENGYRGIFDMATGTGKTFTGLGALTHLAQMLDNKLAVIIACPYQHLVEQWVEDIEKFNMQPIIGYSASGQKDWKIRLERAVRNQKLGVKGKEFFCFICTNATYSSNFVQTQLHKIKGDCLFIVDEAHNFGADYLSRLMIDSFNYRLALSATLERHHDEEGTQKLRDYFGAKCIEYDLEMAIREDKLTRYKYHPIIVSLTDEELKKYYDLTAAICKCLKKDKHGKITLNEQGKRLCLQRARLVAAAENKIWELKKQILPYIDDSHMLVYCGSASLQDDLRENLEVTADEMRQIDVVTDVLGNQMNMKVSQYTSKEDIEERKILTSEFAKGETIQALIAIKCLDEGVNIPSIKTAFILASTTNPKEYIQRRGRVLRKFPGKDFAVIFDFITLPKDINDSVGSTESEIKMGQGLVRNELTRAFEFARLADNFFEADQILDEIRDVYNVHEEVYSIEEEFEYYE